MVSRLAVTFVCGLTFGCAGVSSERSAVPGAAENDTSLGAGDTFDVRVYGQENLTDTYRVAQDGTIDFPLIGRVEVSGLEPTEVADLLAARLEEDGYLIEPQVSILVQEYKSKRISVMGAVAASGTFPMQSGLTVVEAISLAGGFTALANRNDTVVTRRVDGGVRRFRVSVDEITRGRAEDFPLHAGDIVYVPERLF